MIRWVLAAGLLAAAVAPQAMAADLDDGGPAPWRGGAYGYPPPSVPPSYYDDDDHDGPPPARKYTDVPPYNGSCVRSEQVRDRLTSLGWRDFHSGKSVSETAVSLRARRPSGRLFELRLDRCSGEVLAARPLELRPIRPYAYKQPDGPYGAWGPQTPPPSAYGGPYAYGPYAYGGPYANQKWRDRPYWHGGPRRWESD